MTRPGTVGLVRARFVRHPSTAFAEIRAAVGFLTRLPVTVSSHDLDRTGAGAFGLVGAAIGLLAAVPMLLLAPHLALPAAVLALLVNVVASGGLHLDGLADTADALAAPTPDAAERARSDPRAGPAGVAALALDLLLATTLLASIAAADPRLAAAGLVVAAGASRAAATVAGWIEGSRRPRPRSGLGGWFSARVGAVDVIASIVTTALVTAVATGLVGGVAIPFGTVMWLAVAALVAAVVIARRRQLDGDGYGAIVEITFVSILVGIALQVP
jgi:adenosylcobinamide-GDP ribazoletransferase